MSVVVRLSLPCAEPLLILHLLMLKEDRRGQWDVVMSIHLYRLRPLCAVLETKE